jgi:protein TonB
LVAYFIIIGFALVMMIFPTVMKLITPTRADTGVTEVTTLSAIAEVPEDNKIEKIEAPPPPPLKSTIKFTAQKIVEDEKVPDEEIRTMEELVEAKQTISVADVTGNDEVSGQDIADLQDHKLITETEEVFLVGAVEQNPEFPGGQEAMMKWIYNNLRYPAAAQEMGIAGRVTIQFTVWKDGAIRDITVLRGVESSLDKEAVRVVGKMPKWLPGKQGGRAVSVRFILPIVFQIKDQR